MRICRSWLSEALACWLRTGHCNYQCQGMSTINVDSQTAVGRMCSSLKVTSSPGVIEYAPMLSKKIEEFYSDLDNVHMLKLQI